MGEASEGAVEAPADEKRDGRATPASDDDRILRVEP
jgi:hypothetical protein